MSNFSFDSLTGPVPLMVGFLGMSGCGKTRSMLEWCTGAAKVTGGPVGIIDTEAGRALHYHTNRGGPFGFRHLHMEPPYTTERYLEAIDFCFERGCGAVGIDSYSHEHEGIGGALERQAGILESRYNGKESMSAMAWAEPKRARQAVKARLLQIRKPIAFSFRAKDGTDFNYHDPRTLKRSPKGEGLVPIGDRALSYEMTVMFVMRSGADGRPDWHPDAKLEPVTRSLAKCPDMFRQLVGYDSPKPPQVNQAMGEAMARWAHGEQAAASKPGPSPVFLGYSERLERATGRDEVIILGKEIAVVAGLTDTDRRELRAAAIARLDEFTPAPDAG